MSTYPSTVSCPHPIGRWSSTRAPGAKTSTIDDQFAPVVRAEELCSQHDDVGDRGALSRRVPLVELVVGSVEVVRVEEHGREDETLVVDLVEPDDHELGIATQPEPAPPPKPVQHEPVTASGEHVTLDVPAFVEHGTSAFQVRFEGQVAAAGGAAVELHVLG